MTKQTITFGELISLSSIAKPARSFTGPIDVVNGDSDGPSYPGNCTYPLNLAAAVKKELYPATSDKSQYFLAPKCGQRINLHYAAGAAYDHIQAFVKSNGF